MKDQILRFFRNECLFSSEKRAEFMTIPLKEAQIAASTRLGVRTAIVGSIHRILPVMGSLAIIVKFCCPHQHIDFGFWQSKPFRNSPCMGRNLFRMVAQGLGGMTG